MNTPAYHPTTSTGLSALLIALLFLAIDPEAARAQTIDQRYDNALQSFFARDYDTAHDLLSTLTRETPESLPAQGYLFKALIERDTHTLDESLATFALGRSIHPTDRVLILEMAVTHSWAENLDEALSLYEELLTRHPDDLSARQGRARILSWLGRHTEAMTLYETLAEAPDTQLAAFEGIAFIHAARGERRRARAFYEKMLAIDPSHQGARDGLQRLESISIGHVENSTGIVSRRGADTLWETRTALSLKPNTLWDLRIEHLSSTRSQANAASILPFASDPSSPRATQQLSLGVGRALDWRAHHRIAIQAAYQFRSAQRAIGIEGSHRLTERFTALYGARHQRQSMENSNLYRAGFSIQKSERFQNVTQFFFSTSSAQDGFTIALATQQRYWLTPRVLRLDVTLSPGRAADGSRFILGETGLSWQPRRARRLTLHTGLQAGFQNVFINGARMGAKWSF